MKKGKDNNKTLQFYIDLHVKYYKELLRMYLKTHSCRADAENAASDFILKMAEWFSINEAESSKISPAYIKGSFNNFVRDIIRKHKPVYFSELAREKQEDSTDYTEIRFDIPGTDNVESKIFTSDKNSLIKACYAIMHKEDVMYLNFRFIDGFSNIQIATLLGLQADYVANKVNRAKTAFKKAFSKRGYQRGDF
jgi:DNA-directed RNA polymerase specialized sigma24 family protein